MSAADRTSVVVRERHGDVLLVRINRPEARNALNAGVSTGLGQAIIDAEADAGVHAVVVTGTGDRAFCAGLDLEALAAGDVGTGDGSAAMSAFLRLMEGGAGVALVGAANASALAGGLELLLVCDVIVASRDARFGLPEVKRGLFPGGTGTAIGQRLPLAVALEMTLTGEPITAARAYELGLVNRVVAPADVVPEALALAASIAANAPLGVAACRELVRLYATDPAAARVRRDHWRAVVFGSEDAREGAAAFVAKRPPVWQGR